MSQVFKNTQSSQNELFFEFLHRKVHIFCIFFIFYTLLCEKDIGKFLLSIKTQNEELFNKLLRLFVPKTLSLSNFSIIQLYC